MDKNNRLFLAENYSRDLDKNLDFSLDRYNENRGNEDSSDENRGDKGSGNKKDKKPKKPKKLKFKDYKKNTIKSLNEVEFFLNNLDKAFKCVHLFKILR